MKTERRHELQTNELADWLGETIERVAPYSRAIVASVLAVAVLTIVMTVLSKQRTSEQTRAWDKVNEAWEPLVDENNTVELQQAVKQYSGTSAGVWGRLALANVQLSEGVNQMFTDRQKSKESLHDAIDNYSEVLKNTKEPLLLQQATLGLGKAYESDNQFRPASQEYEKVINNWPNSPYATLARGRLEDLRTQSTEDFYRWFAAHTPAPPVPSPGLRPPFDHSRLAPDESEFKTLFEEGTKTKPKEPVPDAGKPDSGKPDSGKEAKKPETNQSGEKPASESKPGSTEGAKGDEKPGEDQKAPSKSESK